MWPAACCKQSAVVWAVAGLLIGSLSVAANGQIPPEDLRLLRRTRVVEVYEAGRESVVFVTGPVFQGDRPKLDEFFDLPGSKPLEQSVGSGFVVHSAGYILTNAHGAERVVEHQVVLADGKRYPAELVATDSQHDVALLKVNAGRPLPAVRLGAAGDVMIGETVVVIGHPLGLMHTCTAGIVSAVGRNTQLADRGNMPLCDLIQTDAAINPGSSGGPWFNVVGEVIGMTVSKKGNADNISFAIPVATLRQVLPKLLDAERRYGLRIGVSWDGMKPCRVAAVAPDSPAAQAGLQPGDVITAVDRSPTPTLVEYQFALVGRRPGERIQLDVLREEKTVQVSLVLGQRPKPDGIALAASKLGLEVAPLDAEAAKAMHLRVPRGVRVTAVHGERYRAVQHKPAPGDVLARVNKIRPRDVDHLGQLLDPIQPGDTVTMVLVRYANQTATRLDIKMTLK